MSNDYSIDDYCIDSVVNVSGLATDILQERIVRLKTELAGRYRHNFFKKNIVDANYKCPICNETIEQDDAIVCITF